MGTRDAAVVRFRHHPGPAVAGVIVAISCLSLAVASGWLALLALLPLAWAARVWRAGTDADRDGIRVRALVGERHIPWTSVRDLAPAGGGRVVAHLTTGSTVPLDAVSPADLPRLAAASGQEVAPAGGQ